MNKKIIITELNIENKNFLLSGLLEDDVLAEVRLESAEVIRELEDGNRFEKAGEKHSVANRKSGIASGKWNVEILGNIYVGRVQKIVKNLNAAFIEIAPGLACYYPLEQNRNPVFTKKINSPNLVQGDELLVQVQREAVKTKAPTVTTNLNLTGRYAVLTTENHTVGVSGKLHKDEKVYYRNLIYRHFCFKSNRDTKNIGLYEQDGKSHYTGEKLLNFHQKNDKLTGKVCDSQETGTIFEDGEIGNKKDDVTGEKYSGGRDTDASGNDFDVQENSNIMFPYGIIIRTNARNASDEEILSEIESLKSKMDDMIAHAPTRTCFSCLYHSEPKYFLFLQNSYKEGLSEIVTDIPEIYAELSDYCSHYADLREIPLRLYDDAMYPMAKLYNLSRQMERAIQKKVWLKSGGFLVIEPTEALTVIDVNTGKSVSKKNVQKHFLETNLEASAEIARQLRLRNISGIIIIDYIDMESRDDQERLMGELRRLVKADPVPVQVHDMTRLNLVEVTRKKVEKSLLEQIKFLEM